MGINKYIGGVNFGICTSVAEPIPADGIYQVEAAYQPKTGAADASVKTIIKGVIQA